MRLSRFLITASLIGVSAVIAEARDNRAWVPDMGDGTYINPVINADYSDPDVVAVGDDFYMTASSFGCAPGLPILHSRDLVNWDIVNYALKEVPPTDFYSSAPRHGKGVWAPSIRFHDGEYYIYWGDPDFGIFMVKTADPLGEWSEPVLVKAGKGMIDPTPLWDDDGRVYLVHAWAASRSRFNSIVTICELNSDGTKVISQPVLVFDGNDGVNHTIEGPKLYKRNGWYYIFAPAGGVVDGWQIVLRSRSIYGPYESRIVMAQGDTPVNGPHQGAWVDNAAGESWFLHFQDRGPYGRVIHLNPMAWDEDWPVIGEDSDGDGCGQPVMRHKKPAVSSKVAVTVPPTSDDFNSRALGRQWQWHANYNDTYGFTSDMGFMRLYGHILTPDAPNFWEVPNLLLQKFPAEEFTATAKVKISAKASSEGVMSGLIVMGWDYGALGVEKTGDNFTLKLVTCHDAEQGNRQEAETIATIKPSRVYEAGLYPNLECDLYLRVKVGKGAVCKFSYSLDGKKFISAGQPFQARAGKWIGAKTGLFSVTPDGNDRGWIDIDNFIVTK
ncbi:MAG TPA: glycoside hydrolase [Porphyromonadaceae bacterium]|nr:glycoside hydrolase [Porphyromonadaceae bacterium]